MGQGVRVPLSSSKEGSVVGYPVMGVETVELCGRHLDRSSSEQAFSCGRAYRRNDSTSLGKPGHQGVSLFTDFSKGIREGTPEEVSILRQTGSNPHVTLDLFHSDLELGSSRILRSDMDLRMFTLSLVIRDYEIPLIQIKP